MTLVRSSSTRRSFLRTMGQAFVALHWFRIPRVLRASRVEDGAAFAGHIPTWKLALHNHGSFSEGPGSWYAAMVEADANDIDVMYATDHDWRMQALHHRPSITFSALREEWHGSEWEWVPVSTGDLAWSAGGIDYVESSPSDPSPTTSSLKVVATAQGAARASHGFRLDDNIYGRADLRTNIAGQTLTVDVKPTGLNDDAWLELRVTLSEYPELGGFAAGHRVLAYRFGSRAGDVRSGLTGVVWIPAPNDEWTTFHLDLSADAARLFPELPNVHDNALYKLAIVAVSENGAQAKGWFDHLIFDRSKGGEAGYVVQREILDSYADAFTVEARQGDEISFTTTHHCWLFSRPEPVDYSGFSSILPAWSESAVLRERIISTVHENGGLSSYTHPFGTGFGPLLADVTDVVENTAAQLLAGQLAGDDMLEVGYAIRGKVGIDGHLGLWDILSRNEVFITGTGVTDSHSAEPGQWVGRANRFLTIVRAPSTDEDDLKAAILAGQAWGTEMGPSSDLELDIEVEGARMGSVSVNPGRAERLATLTCRSIPGGGTLELIQGPVDGGMTYPTSSTLHTLTEADLVDGVATRSVVTTSPTFVRTQVRDDTGRLVAFSNPIWLLHETPAAGIPPERIGDLVAAQEVFVGSGDAPAWHSFGFDVGAGADLLVRLDGVAEGAVVTLFLKNPSGTTVAFDTSPALVKYVQHRSAQAGRWRVGVGVKQGTSSFRALVKPTSTSLQPPIGSIAAWQGWGDPITNSWQRFRFQADQAGSVQVLLDGSDPEARVNLFLKDGSGDLLAFDNSSAHPKTIDAVLQAPGSYDVFVKIKDAATPFDIVVRPA